MKKKQGRLEQILKITGLKLNTLKTDFMTKFVLSGRILHDKRQS